MDEDGAVPSRDVAVLDDNVVVGRTADGVDTDAERVDEFLIDEPELDGGPGHLGRLVNGSLRRAGNLLLFGDEGVPAACSENHFARTTELLPARHFEMHTVEAR